MSLIIGRMRKIAIIILAGFLLLAGCEKEQEQQQSEFERVSEQIEQAKAEAREKEQTPAGQKSAEELTGNIKVTVRMLTVDERDFEALDSLWGYTTSSFVVIRRADIFPDSGLKVHMGAGDLTARLEAIKRSAKYSEGTEVFLVLADKATGYINMGTEIAVPRFYYLTRWYEAADYQFRRAGRGFKVTVRRIPGRDLINVQLTPVLSRFLNDGGDKEFTELKAAVTVKPGQSILIGGSRTSRENLSSALLGLRQEKVLKDTVVLVDVSLL
jgi:hypothetical protein